MPESTDLAAGETVEEPRRSNWLEGFRLVLAPIAGILMILVIVQAVYGIQHWASLPSYPANSNGVSSASREASILFYIASGFVGPIAAAFLWFDWIHSKMTRPRRRRVELLTPVPSTSGHQIMGAAERDAEVREALSHCRRCGSGHFTEYRADENPESASAS
jgi:hypothetical protein